MRSVIVICVAAVIVTGCDPYASCKGNPECIKAVADERKAKIEAKERTRRAAIEKDKGCVKVPWVFTACR